MFEVITRDVWQAEVTFDEQPLERPAGHVFYTLTDCSPCFGVDQCAATLRALQRRYVMIKQMIDIPYNFMIGGDGRVYEGRGWGIAPDLPKRIQNFEDNAFNLLFMMNNIGEPVPRAMLEIKDEIIKYGIQHDLIVRLPKLHKPIRQVL
ncbi:peptidoglycan recognition protein 3-like [Macrosteles quadrilineatus]|uniref:peptidoglycan recognition protein 3-like n=1 Tax=Macrosteles quadrilineatus TaxID=74068 RepID=UPI0023E157BF|nr:peptidoglycan recognition protein 3-like [Macrosteles quadrilineatus]